MSSIFKKYLDKLELPKRKPSIYALTNIVTAHLMKIPFENISKIYYYKNYYLANIPDFELYINGIVEKNFGGTCYSNNYYLNKLLNYLGYDVKLCGADMTNPDVHIVNIINIENHDYLVDVGYAAPFLNPLPLDLTENYQMLFGADKYVLVPKNIKGYSELQLFRNGKLKHGYMVKPHSRTIAEFDKNIEDSFKDSATFLNSILLVKYGINSSTVIHNFSITESEDKNYKKRILSNEDELVNEIEKKFRIKKEIIKYSLTHISNYNDAWN